MLHRGLVLLLCVPVAYAPTDSSRRQCLDVAEQHFAARCGFSAGTVAQRGAQWACTTGCAATLLPWVDNCVTCEDVPALNEARDPLTCHIPEESWTVRGICTPPECQGYFDGVAENTKPHRLMLCAGL